jgi:threonine/homoserine/homoserine lactone efflux protein
MSASNLVALLLFAAAGSGSPGPNNTMLLASGMRFGLRGTIPHVAGTAAGIGALVVAVAAGIGVVLEAIPVLKTGLKVAGSVYLLVLAFRLAVAGAVGRGEVSRPLTFRQAVIFQFVNPKGWIFAIAVVAAFLPPGPSPVLGGLVVAAILCVVVGATAALWALGGAVLAGATTTERSQRAATIVLAALMVASVVLLWI